jgi:hypothetical protein
MQSIPIAVAARSGNVKTGDVPTVWVGRNRAQSLASCDGCALLASGDCYAQYGTPLLGQSSIAATAAKRKSWRTYAITYALKHRARSARMVRFSALGDVARADAKQVREAIRETIAAGLAVVGYTHFWREKRAAYLRGRLMASVSGETEAREANDQGWRAAMVMPAGTTGTLRNDDGSVFAVECPAIAAARFGKSFTCNDCASTRRGALCDASIDAPNVYFADHGPKARKRALPVVKG